MYYLPVFYFNKTLSHTFVYTFTILSNLHFLTMNGFVTFRARHRDTTFKLIKSFEKIEKKILFTYS